MPMKCKRIRKDKNTRSNDEMLVSIIVLSYSNILQCFELKEPWLVVPLEIGSSRLWELLKAHCQSWFRKEGETTLVDQWSSTSRFRSRSVHPFVLGLSYHKLVMIFNCLFFAGMKCEPFSNSCLKFLLYYFFWEGNLYFFFFEK